ncbi:MAG: peroxiredoxin [Phycisphaerales bacterium]
MLKPGAKAPHFTLTDDAGRPHNLPSLTERGPLLLYFYPADFAPGCVRQACMLREHHAELTAAGITLAGISPQGAISHARLRDKHDLPFILLTDPTKTVIKAYHADGPLGIGVRRVTYLISEDRHILDALRADFNIDKHREFVDRVLARHAAPAET